MQASEFPGKDCAEAVTQSYSFSVVCTPSNMTGKFGNVLLKLQTLDNLSIFHEGVYDIDQNIWLFDAQYVTGILDHFISAFGDKFSC